MSEALKTQINNIFKGFSYRGFIAILVIVFSFIYLFLLMRYEVPEGNRSISNIAAGLLLGLDATIVAYYFGSSKDTSDSNKATAVNDLLNNQKGGND